MKTAVPQGAPLCLQAIDYISKLSQSAVPGKDIEAAFKTKGGFAVWASIRGKSEVIAAVSSQGKDREAVARINFSDLPQLKRLMQEAKAEIDAAPQSGNQLDGSLHKSRAPH